MKYIYLDNSATTALTPAVKTAMGEATELFANPSSLHAAGLEAKALLARSRESVASALGVRSLKPGQLIFTASGTEADNLAVFGSVYAKERNRGGKILTTDSEHPAVENCMKKLESDGYRVVRIPTRGGVLDMETFRREMTRDVILVSLMTVNNETGAVYDVKTAFSIAKSVNPTVVTHTDAVQAFLKMRLCPDALGADLCTVSSHKIHGPKGVGALYVNPAVLTRRQLVPVNQGGGQEFGFRSGTENVIGIAGFARAAADGYADLAENLGKMQSVRENLERKLAVAVPEIRVNRPVGTRAPHILSLTTPDIKSETVLHFLSERGICISAGSACSSHAAQHHPSESLLAFGLTEREADATVRVSISEETAEEETDALVAALSDAVGQLIRMQ